MTPLATLHLGPHRYAVTRARRADVPALAALLRDDPLGRTRETADLAAYETAFAAVDRDPAHLLVAVRDERDEVVATLQLTLLPGLLRGGATRVQVEGVRVRTDARRFYERRGWVATHTGMKLPLD